MTDVIDGMQVTAGWLFKNLAATDMVILDATLGAPGQWYIPGARRFDLDRTICDQNTALPHMMPASDLFEQEVRRLGVNHASLIIVYDAKGVYSSPRARWMFKAMGHDAVVVLDGGLPSWLEAGYPVEPAPKSVRSGDFKATPRATLFCNADEVARALEDPAAVVVDARSAGRFHGREPEPLPGLRAGHMPGAVNVPFTDVLDRGRFKPAAELRAAFRGRIEQAEKLIFSCGSGVTACIPAFAAELLGRRNISIYDGSWSEWGLPTGRPVVTD